MNDIARQKEHFENISGHYYSARQSKNHLLIKKFLWSYFFKNKDFLKSEVKSVLEPMCGYAEGKKIMEVYLGIQFDYEGFDYSSNLVEMVKKTTKV